MDELPSALVIIAGLALVGCLCWLTQSQTGIDVVNLAIVLFFFFFL